MSDKEFQAVEKKIKVLHLIKSLGRGGAEKLIPETALVHNQNRFEFHCLYFYHQENNITDELEKAGIIVHLIPSGNLGLFFHVKKVRDFILSNEIDIIHAHLPWAGIMARSVGNTLSIPIVYTEHNTWERYNKFSYWGNRLSFKKQDVAIAVSNEVALSMRLNSIWDPYQRGGRMKLKVIQNGVNTDIFRRAGIQESIVETKQGTIEKKVTRSKCQVGSIEIDRTLRINLNIPDNAPVIGIVAVFRSQKRLWLWVDVALKILEQYPHTHFMLVGGGEWRERIEAQIKRSGKSANFHLVGVQKNVIPYLSLMDIYLSTSEFEGLPIAMLEAMSCEVPVVATSAGGIGEVIQQGVQGYLAEIGSWDKLSGYCCDLIQKPDLHDRMRLAARERVIEQFSVKRMVSELEQVYLDVIA
ncbi:glycosyltransferase involved in cell wall biosynthesis [Algoriphagus sp. 4150]|uniref:glycosyltransferase n=1 Tax=Algoriphagus sp. 4150 TaxID=2817756 RepID=UPI00286337F2|nr:glycosyltransferase [Algoriphagus sp. 4150]MDR7130612.1 glycosyltransferase involved in cell wall biosynthesis [Algoriphagus sp. 4150]